MELNTLQNETARDNETQLRRVLSISRNRAEARKIMNISNGHMSRFLSTAEDESKININSLSKVLAAMGFQLSPKDEHLYDPHTHTPVPIPALKTMNFLSAVGHSALFAIHEYGPNSVHESVLNSAGFIDQG